MLEQLRVLKMYLKRINSEIAIETPVDKSRYELGPNSDRMNQC